MKNKQTHLILWYICFALVIVIILIDMVKGLYWQIIPFLILAVADVCMIVSITESEDEEEE